MKTVIAIAFLFLSGCGYSALNSTFTAQVKYVENANPIMCDNYTYSGMSLGVTRNGTGSVSTHDITVYVPNEELANKLQAASHDGKLVTITYDEKRWRWCVPNMEVKKVEVLQ